MKRLQATILFVVMISALFIRAFSIDTLPAPILMTAYPGEGRHPSSAFAAPQSKSYPASHRVIGTPGRHMVKKRETVLDVAREYDLGFNEMRDLYPRLDPWLLKEGTVLTIPTQWVLPMTDFRGIVINVAELRLYCYLNDRGGPRVTTFPVGIGDRDFPIDALPSLSMAN